MAGKKIEDYMNDIDEDFFKSEHLITKRKLNNLSENKKKYRLKINKKVLLTILFTCIWMFIYMSSNKDTITLAQSVGNISAEYIDRAPVKYSYNSEQLNEEEFFLKNNTTIIGGKVKDVNNIRIQLNGEAIYRSIAQIEVTKVYRGDCEVGQVVSVLIPCTIHIGLDIVESEVISNLRIGMNGIFMMKKYDEKSYIEDEGSILYLQDLAEYGFSDSQKYGFLEGEEELIFDKGTFKSIKNATDLEEIESYIKKMID
ncbi:hypothetical protein [Intestinibacter bartlettii]|uniref:Uncharacterized protein n=3 Tax=Intestinibacter bartlettii TaxID=261299 RepID=A0ABS6E018_9FIRM|nr:hypothetical protein [Intestinibacter bartlettii]MBU5337449.1 hypothetical protein [Intestinibacter bartlettii]